MITIRDYRLSDQKIWEDYVKNHYNGTLYHLSGWKNVIEKTYGHKTYYLIAVNDNQKLATSNSQQENAYGLSAIRKDSSNSNPTNPSNSTNQLTQATVAPNKP